MTQVAKDYWEEKYAKGHGQSYPWDMVVSFLMRAPKALSKRSTDIRVLELGCGTAANLWCAAREGFKVTGIDISQSAVQAARRRFEVEKLPATFIESAFSPLPFPDESFELVIDRASLTCVSRPEIANAITEVHRVLSKGGLLFSQGYSDSHSSKAFGTKIDDATRIDIDGGTLAGQAQITFLSRDDIHALFKANWTLTQLQHVRIEDHLAPGSMEHAEWRLIARKA